MKNAVIYARYSPGPQQTDQSIEGQVRECRQYAERNGLKIIDIYADKAQSGRTDNRAEFQRMLRDAKRGKFAVLLVWKIDRFGRNREEIARNKAFLRLAGVSVEYACEHIPDGPEGIILEAVLEGMAEYYSANLAQNTLRGMRENALKAKSNGSGIATGYVTGADGRFVVEPHEADLVRKVYSDYLDGRTMGEIAASLQAYSTKRGKKFTIQSVAKILRNRNYIGEYRWMDVVIPDGMPAIIDDDTFGRVQLRLAERGRNHRKGATYMLTGKVFCGHCGGSMVGTSGTSKTGDVHYYYSCLHRKQGKGCKKMSVRKEWLEREVVKLTVENVLRDDVIELIADKVMELQYKEREDNSKVVWFEEKLAETQKGIDNLVKAIENGLLTEEIDLRLRQLADDKAAYQNELAAAQAVQPILPRDTIVAWMKLFKSGDVDDPEYCRRLIDTFVNKIVLYDDRIIITYNYSGDSRREVPIADLEAAAEFESYSPRWTRYGQCELVLFFCSGVFGLTCRIDR